MGMAAINRIPKRRVFLWHNGDRVQAHGGFHNRNPDFKSMSRGELGWIESGVAVEAIQVVIFTADE